MRIEKTKVRSFFDEFVELVDKPSSVVDNHSSRRQITLPLKQPTRTLDGPPIEFLFGLATSGVYLAMVCYQSCGGLLPHPFTLTHRYSMGGLLSVALSRGSPRVAVSHRPALWSPDVPQPRAAVKTTAGTAAARSARPHASV